jgi:small subunit ribosomal protein S16
MLTIRLTRKGKKNQPFFRVVLVDKRKSAKSGSAIEILGNVDPLTKKRNFKKDRILYWLSKGAKASPTVHNLFVSEKIVDAKKIHVSKLSKKKQAEMAKAKEEATAKVKAEEPKPAAEVKALEAETPVETLPAPAEPAPAETPAEPEKPAEEPPTA